MNNSLEISSKKINIEYQMRTDLPKLLSGNSKDILRIFERQSVPKNPEKLLEAWTELVGSKMKYDVMNYALMKEYPMDATQGGWIDKLDMSKLSLSSEQIALTINTLQEYGKPFEKGSLENINIELMILSLKKRNYKEFIPLLVEWPSLQGYLLSDEKFAKKWMQIYEKKGTPELLQRGIGNCKTLAIMTKNILETGNDGWNLGIKSIEIIEGADSHVTLKVHTKESIIQYDPMQVLYSGKSTPE